MSYPFQTAAFVARRLLITLEPFCEPREVAPRDAGDEPLQSHDVAWIRVAGSIRRKRPRVNDIDIVAVPKPDSGALFDFAAGRVRHTEFFKRLTSVLKPVECAGEKIIRGKLAMSDAPAIGVDCYIATKETWATLLLIRTGSAEHNRQLAVQARQLGMELHASGESLTRGAEKIVCDTEEEIFVALKLPYKPPEAR